MSTKEVHLGTVTVPNLCMNGVCMSHRGHTVIYDPITDRLYKNALTWMRGDPLPDAYEIWLEDVRTAADQIWLEDI